MNKFWKNKLNIDDLNNEVNIISAVIKKEENIEKIKNNEKRLLEENKNKKISNKKNNNDYEFKFISKTPMQNVMSKNNNNKNFRTITPSKNLYKKY